MKKNHVLNPLKNNKTFFAVAVGLLIPCLATITIINKNQNEGTRPSQISSEAPTIQPTVTGSTEELTVYPTGEQKDCPQGFYYFENEDFSICYPNTMRVNPPEHIQNAN